jgi:peptide/nickel transport system substrate-binding protein
MIQKLLIFSLIIGLFSACQNSPETNKTSVANHLRVATPFKIQHLDPLKSGHYFLVEFGAAELPARLDADGKIKPWLLESFEQIDKLNWKLRVRPNIKFQNGKPLTAEIFARVMNRHLEKSPETKVAMGKASVKITGENEIILTTEAPNPSVPSALADETVFPIYDAETVEAIGADSLKLAGKGVYTGAYKIAAVDEREMLMERNEHYRQGTPPFERVSILFVTDPQARILAVQNGEADISLYPQTQNKRMLENRDDAFFKLSEKSAGGPSLFFNTKIAPFDDANVRRAVSFGINYESLAVETMDGIYLPANGFYAPSFPLAKPNQKTDFEQAKKLLDESGWQSNADGIREKNGKKLEAEILIYPQQADFSALATALQAQLRQIGFDIKIRQVDDIQSEVRRSKTWNFYILGNGNLTTGGAPDPILQRYFLSDSEENHSGISDAKLDERIKTLSQTFDETERNKILGEIQDIIITEKAYLVRLGFSRSKAVVGKRFKNYEPSPQMFHITFETNAD